LFSELAKSWIAPAISDCSKSDLPAASPLLLRLALTIYPRKSTSAVSFETIFNQLSPFASCSYCLLYILWKERETFTENENIKSYLAAQTVNECGKFLETDKLKTEYHF
jgi:hypothetical protein